VISSDRCRRPRGSANSAVPQSPGHGIQCWAGTSTSPFARFWKALCRATHSSTRGPCDPSIFRTFPMPLPYPEAVGPGGGACETRESVKRSWAGLEVRKTTHWKLWVNVIVAMFNFWELGSPKGGYKLCSMVSELGQAQKKVVQHLTKFVRRFCASDGGNIAEAGGGRTRLHRALACLDTPSRPVAEALETMAETVDIARVSLPEHAGVLDPLKLECLPEEYRDDL
jgi:hypothetical protein